MTALRGWRAAPGGGLVRATPPIARPAGFLSTEGLAALPGPQWLVEPYIAEGALIMLAAAANAGKTFVALDWSLRVADQGHRVLYLALEGLHGLAPRVTAWQEHHGRQPANIQYSRPGYRLNLLDPRSVGLLCEEIGAVGPFALVVVDNLGEAFPGDENDSRSVGQAVASLKRVQSAAGGSVLDLHNFGHGGSRARGHSKLIDAHDTIVYLHPIDNSDGLRITSGKERNAERFAPRSVSLRSVGESLVVVPGASVLEHDEVLAALAGAAGPLTITQVADRIPGLDRKTVQRKVTRLVEGGAVTKAGRRGNATTYELAYSEVA